MKKMTKAMTRANNMVVRVVMCLMTISVCVATFSSCTNDDVENPVGNTTENNILVDLSFSPYEMTPMTRAATSISNYCTRLDVWIIDEDNETIDLHQSSTDEDFGTVSVALNKTKTYSLVAVAHKCNSEAEYDDGIIAFPDEKVTHAMCYTTTFSPATSTSLNCEMSRIVGQFRFEIAEVVPEEVTTMQFTISDSYTRWNIEGSGENAIDRTTTFNNISRANDGTAAFTLYVIPSNLTDLDTFNITVAAQTAQGDVVEERFFEDVPIKAGYKTTYRGTFFVTTDEQASFTVEDWNAFDTVTY